MTATGFAAMLPVICHFIVVTFCVAVSLLLELSKSSSVLGLQVEAGMNRLILKSELGNNRTSVGVTNKCVASQFRVVSQYTQQEVEPICIAISPAEIHPHISSVNIIDSGSANLGSRDNSLINRLHLMRTLFSRTPSIPQSGNLNIE